MASAEAEIRHVFGATCLTEGSIGPAPPDIVKLSEPVPSRRFQYKTIGKMQFGMRKMLFIRKRRFYLLI